MCWPDGREQNERASVAIVAARPFIALISLHGAPYDKGRFIIFSRVELVNFPVFIWQGRLSFAKKSAIDLKFRLSLMAVSHTYQQVHRDRADRAYKAYRVYKDLWPIKETK
jgi:hypothetical protein